MPRHMLGFAPLPHRPVATVPVVVAPQAHWRDSGVTAGSVGLAGLSPQPPPRAFHGALRPKSLWRPVNAMLVRPSPRGLRGLSAPTVAWRRPRQLPHRARGLPTRLAYESDEAQASDGLRRGEGVRNALVAVGVLLLFLGPAVFFATWTAGLFVLGSASILALIFFFTPFTIAVAFATAAGFAALAATQVSFSVLATSLAAGALLFKSSIVVAAGLLSYKLLGGDLSALPGINDESDKASAPAEESSAAGRPKAAVAAEEAPVVRPLDEKLRDWDQRFEATGGSSSVAAIKFEDLSPNSPISQLRAFAAQEGLTLTETDGRRKAEIYRQIALKLLRRSK